MIDASNDGGRPRSPKPSRFAAGGWPVLAVMTSIACGVLLPNFILFSTDDLEIYRKSGEAGIVVSQAGIGRYTFYLMGLLLSASTVDYNSYLIVSIVVFALGMAVLYLAAASLVGLAISIDFALGYAVLLTFGFNLDLYQYQYAYLQYGTAFACVAGLVELAHRVRSPSLAVASAAILAFVGLGAYQLFAQLTVMTVLALCVACLMRAGVDGPAHLRRTVGVSLIALVVGAVLYLAVNSALRRLGIAAFAHYPVRGQGLMFAYSNLPVYFRTLLELVDVSDPRYRPLLPKLWRAAFAATVMAGTATLWCHGLRRGVLGTSLVAAALVLWPNPANLFLADYWPSARSMSGFGIFLGIFCAALFGRSQRLVRPAGRLGRLAVAAVVVCQCVLMGLRYQDRFVQQEADVALAQAILLRAYAAFPIGEPVAIDLAVSPEAVQTAKPLVYDFGRSMFATSWSAPAFLEHLSGHRVSARAVSLGECASSATRLAFEMRGDRLLVCLLAR